MAIDRFMARRGRPDSFWSDIGTNFDIPCKEVNNIETPDFQKNCAQRRIKWKFSTPSATIQGGAWQILIKSCKMILFTVLESSKVKEEVLSTSTVEKSFSPQFLPENHITHTTAEFTSMLNQKPYGQVGSRYTCLPLTFDTNGQTTEPLAKGELAWLRESHSPRGNYLLARVCELHYDRKGVARTAKLMTRRQF